jgi:hypothetical protein
VQDKALQTENKKNSKALHLLSSEKCLPLSISSMLSIVPVPSVTTQQHHNTTTPQHHITTGDERQRHCSRGLNSRYSPAAHNSANGTSFGTTEQYMRRLLEQFTARKAKGSLHPIQLRWRFVGGAWPVAAQDVKI